MLAGETADPPAPPVSARTAALRVELAETPPVRHGRRRPHHARITGRGILIYFLPYFALAAAIVAAVLTLKGFFR